jgi:hypothetical protein
MKIFIKILLVMIFGLTSLNAQEKTTQDKKQEKVEQEKKIPQTDETVKTDNPEQKFVDKNGDGIDDSKQMKGKMKRKGKMDTFEDKDGDGINDNRCQGMGWGKGSRKGYGKNSR